MAFTHETKTQKPSKEIKELQIKARILDELFEFLEERYLGYLMALAEEEPKVPLSKARKLMRTR